VRSIIKPMKGVQEVDLQIVFVDLEREDTVPYGMLAKLKNGWLFSPKYDSVDLTFPPVHVVCFANFPPAEAKLSADRWEIIEL